MAAVVNGAAAISLELDEGNQFATNHPAAHILPGLLAVAEVQALEARYGMDEKARVKY